ncbi:hypothetical protein, partial [Nocardia sp. NPDC004722]
MIEQPTRSTRFVRVFGLLALMAGIVAMHALVLGMGNARAEHTLTTQHTETTQHSMSAEPAAVTPAAM